MAKYYVVGKKAGVKHTWESLRQAITKLYPLLIIEMHNSSFFGTYMRCKLEDVDVISVHLNKLPGGLGPDTTNSVNPSIPKNSFVFEFDATKYGELVRALQLQLQPTPEN
jgi:hypothetical protein